MLGSAYCLSSTPNPFAEECNTFKGILLKLKHPERLIDSIMTTFTESQNQQQIRDVKQMHLFGLFCHLKIKNQLIFGERQLCDLGKRINKDLRPVSTSKEIVNDIRIAEVNPPLTN